MNFRIRVLAVTAGVALGMAAGIVHGAGTTDIAAHSHGINDSIALVTALGGTPVVFGVDADLIPANIPVHLQPI